MSGGVDVNSPGTMRDRTGGIFIEPVFLLMYKVPGCCGFVSSGKKYPENELYMGKCFVE